MNIKNLSDEEIWHEIDELAKTNTSPSSYLATGYNTRIVMYLVELQRRIAEKMEKSSKRFAATSLIVAMVAILISLAK